MNLGLRIFLIHFNTAYILFPCDPFITYVCFDKQMHYASWFLPSNTDSVIAHHQWVHRVQAAGGFCSQHILPLCALSSWCTQFLFTHYFQGAIYSLSPHKAMAIIFCKRQGEEKHERKSLSWLSSIAWQDKKWLKQLQKESKTCHQLGKGNRGTPGIDPGDQPTVKTKYLLRGIAPETVNA